MSYQDYLGALLVCHGAKKAIAGLMDVMESDIRQTPGNSNFRAGWPDRRDAGMYPGSQRLYRKL